MPVFNQKKIERVKKINKILKIFFLFSKKKYLYDSFQKTEIKNIIIISFFLIGDTIMYMPALKVIRRNFSNSKITLIGGDTVKTILKEQNIFDSFIIVECPWIAPFKTNLKNIFSFIKGIFIANRQIKYDLAIDFRGDWRNIFYLNFIKSKYKLSFNFVGGEYMLTHAFKPNNTINHLGDESFYFLKLINCSFSEEDKIPKLKVSNKAKGIQNDIKKNIPNDKVIIGIHPGTSQKIKQWSKEKYLELIIKLMADDKGDNLFFIIFGGPGEDDILRFIVDELNKFTDNFSVIKRNLETYIASISVCDMMICNDSGAAHIAAAYSIPVVIIFANVDPKFVTPKSFNQVKVISHSLHCKPCFNSICQYGTNECIKNISVEEVFFALKDIDIKNRNN